MASSPVRASPATSMSTRPEKTCLSPIRTTSWSSTISKRIIGVFPDRVIQEAITPRCPTPLGVGSFGFVCRNNPTRSLLKGVAEDNSVPFYGNVLALQAGKVRHQRTRGLVDDVPRPRVVAKRAGAAAGRPTLLQ